MGMGCLRSRNSSDDHVHRRVNLDSSLTPKLRLSHYQMPSSGTGFGLGALTVDRSSRSLGGCCICSLHTLSGRRHLKHPLGGCCIPFISSVPLYSRGFGALPVCFSLTDDPRPALATGVTTSSGYRASASGGYPRWLERCCAICRQVTCSACRPCRPCSHMQPEGF